ncbi:hypothetical protein D7X33_27820, partial [Butyricicoccus sp. 1XD8-22]
MLGYNKAGEVIANAHFSMGNYNAGILYSLLDSQKFNAGVSGSGDSSVFTIQQIEKALADYKVFINNEEPLIEEDYLNSDQTQILKFIKNCLATA